MSDIPASTWSATDDNNTTSSPAGFPTGMPPSGVDNSARAVMGGVKRWYDWSIPKTTAGSSTAFTATYSPAPGALLDGMSFCIQLHTAIGASATLNVNSLGATPLHYFANGSWAAVPTGTIKSGAILQVRYNSSAGSFRISASPVPVARQAFSTQSYTTIQGAQPVFVEWGQVTVGGGSTHAVTYTAPFTTAPLPMLTANGNTGSLAGAPYVSAGSSSGFTINHNGTNTINFVWLAIGA